MGKLPGPSSSPLPHQPLDSRDLLLEPAWVAPIKEAARARARARGIAEVQANRDEEDGTGTLKVVNGLPSIISTTTTGGSSTNAVEDDEGESTLGVVYEDYLEQSLAPPLFPPPFKRTNTAETIVLRGEAVSAAMDGTTQISSRGRARTQIDGLPGAPVVPSYDELDPLNDDPTAAFDPPKAFVPSLTTIEKAVATRVRRSESTSGYENLPEFPSIGLLRDPLPRHSSQAARPRPAQGDARARTRNAQHLGRRTEERPECLGAERDRVLEGLEGQGQVSKNSYYYLNI